MSLFAAIKQRFDQYQPLRNLGLPELRAFEAKQGDDSSIPYVVMVPVGKSRTEAGTSFVYMTQDVQFSIFHDRLETLEKIEEAMFDCFPDRVDLELNGKQSALSMRHMNSVYTKETQRVYHLEMEFEVLLSRPR